MAKRPRYANNLLTLAKRPRYANNLQHSTFNIQHPNLQPTLRERQRRTTS
ncbi:hypothetical protein [Moorena sp. SIO3I6]|nr:hypothetical protein [Moorena sp. SIO3I6]NEP22810.1 hypothetical protein [Moorena sp. SIO3I6]